MIAAGLAFGAGWAIGRWGNYWGGGCNWGNRNLYVNHLQQDKQHREQLAAQSPAHRQGVRYNNANVQQRFGNNNLKAGASNRMDFRGRDGSRCSSDRIVAGGADRRRRSAGSAATVRAIVADRPEHGGSRQAVVAIVPRQGCQPRQQRRARWR